MSNSFDRRFIPFARGLPNVAATIASGVAQNFVSFLNNSPSSSGGTSNWTDAANAETSDTLTAGNICTSTESFYLRAYDIATKIPSGVTVDGITIRVERKVVLGAVEDTQIKIVKGGAVGTTNKSTSAVYPAAYAYTSFGGAADKWGETWTAADINSGNFGVVITCTGTGGAFDIAAVDHIEVTIHYT